HLPKRRSSYRILLLLWRRPRKKREGGSSSCSAAILHSGATSQRNRTLWKRHSRRWEGSQWTRGYWRRFASRGVGTKSTTCTTSPRVTTSCLPEKRRSRATPASGMRARTSGTTSPKRLLKGSPPGTMGGLYPYPSTIYALGGQCGSPNGSSAPKGVA